MDYRFAFTTVPTLCACVAREDDRQQIEFAPGPFALPLHRSCRSPKSIARNQISGFEPVRLPSSKLSRRMSYPAPVQYLFIQRASYVSTYVTRLTIQRIERLLRSSYQHADFGHLVKTHTSIEFAGPSCGCRNFGRQQRAASPKRANNFLSE